jgi:DNA repair protein RAD5
MGKTIQIAALLHKHRTFLHDRDESTSEYQAQLVAGTQKQAKLSAAFNINKSGAKQTLPSSRMAATLIVAPTSLLYQWEAELNRCSKKGIMNAVVWHGQGRGDLDELFDVDMDDDESIRVVITSYGVLGSEWSKHFKARRNYESPLFSSGFSFMSLIRLLHLYPS